MNESIDQTPKEISPAPSVEKKNTEGLRTYAGDFGKSISGERGDIIRRAIREEEQKAQVAKAQTLASRQNIMLLVGSILAVIIGIVAIVYLALGSRIKTIEPMVNKVPSIVFADSSKEIMFTGITKEQLISQVKTEIAATIPNGTIKNIFFTDARSGVKYLAGAKAFLSLLSGNVPELLTDGLENTFMLGTYGTHAPFIVLKTDAYNDAFSGMRTWESRLFDDLYQLFAIPTSGDNSNLFEAKFEDAVLKNKNARVLHNAAGTVVLLYAFPDEHTIVIATDPAALEEVSVRLASQKVEQPAK